MSRYIDADAYCAEMRDFQNRISKWVSEAETDEAKHRSESAYVTLVEAKLILDKQPTVGAVEVKNGQGMKKYIVLGGYEPYVIEVEDWESAFWKAYDHLKESLVSITAIPEEEE